MSLWKLQRKLVICILCFILFSTVYCRITRHQTTGILGGNRGRIHRSEEDASQSWDTHESVSEEYHGSQSRDTSSQQGHSKQHSHEQGHSKQHSHEQGHSKQHSHEQGHSKQHSHEQGHSKQHSREQGYSKQHSHEQGHSKPHSHKQGHSKQHSHKQDHSKQHSDEERTTEDKRHSFSFKEKLEYEQKSHKETNTNRRKPAHKYHGTPYGRDQQHRRVGRYGKVAGSWKSGSSITQEPLNGYRAEKLPRDHPRSTQHQPTHYGFPVFHQHSTVNPHGRLHNKHPHGLHPSDYTTPRNKYSYHTEAAYDTSTPPYLQQGIPNYIQSPVAQHRMDGARGAMGDEFHDEGYYAVDRSHLEDYRNHGHHDLQQHQHKDNVHRHPIDDHQHTFDHHQGEHPGPTHDLHYPDHMSHGYGQKTLHSGHQFGRQRQSPHHPPYHNDAGLVDGGNIYDQRNPPDLSQHINSFASLKNSKIKFICNSFNRNLQIVRTHDRKRRSTEGKKVNIFVNLPDNRPKPIIHHFGPKLVFLCIANTDSKVHMSR